jgi:hypothetical protein
MSELRCDRHRAFNRMPFCLDFLAEAQRRSSRAIDHFPMSDVYRNIVRPSAEQSFEGDSPSLSHVSRAPFAVGLSGFFRSRVDYASADR